MAVINKVSHVVLNVRDVEESVRFYHEALGMEIVAVRQEGRMAFLSFGTQHHDIALFGTSDGERSGSLGLNHIALQVQGGIEELTVAYQRLLDHGARIDRLADHGFTKSVYFLDPDGNRLEIYCETMEAEEAKRYLKESSGGIKPLTLETTAAR